MSDVNDELDGLLIFEEVFGDVLGKLKVFYVKFVVEGELCGLIGLCDVGIIWEWYILNFVVIVLFICEVMVKR